MTTSHTPHSVHKTGSHPTIRPSRYEGLAAAAGLDATDRALLSALRVNARASVAELARTLDITRATITKRIDRLERRGVIRGYTVRVAEQAADASIRAVCHLAIEGRAMTSTVATLRGMSAVSELYSTNGEWDLVVRLDCTSLGDLDQTLGRIREIDGVRASETSILLRDLLT